MADAMEVEHELVGRVWDQWGSLTPHQRRRIARRHPRLAATLDDITEHVRNDMVGVLAPLLHLSHFDAKDAVVDGP